MDKLSQLTSRELQVAELLAWGASKKEIPDLLPDKAGRLPISVFTVENITRNIFRKLEIQKVSELSAVYFCCRFNISLSLSPLKQKIISLVFVILLTPQVFSHIDVIRPQRVIARSMRINRARGKENVFNGLLM